MEISLTVDELDKLRTIVACHVDLVIQPKINEAMKKMNENETARLLQVKMDEQQILAKLWEVKT